MKTSSATTGGDVLVAIMNDENDFALARDEHWYRIPKDSAEKWCARCWPPRWLAFYQTKEFGPEAHSVRYYAEVHRVKQVLRWQLFPDGPRNAKSQKPYYQLLLGPLQQLSTPVLSRRFRKIVFIPTTWEKLQSASEINDLFDESPLEDRLWAEFKRLKIPAERQEFVELKSDKYFLDFAIYCARGKIDVETDGDAWHANPERAAPDNRRDNALRTKGWTVLRFNTSQVLEQLMEDCIPTIAATINSLGGVEESGVFPRRIELSNAAGLHQKGLFDSS